MSPTSKKRLDVLLVDLGHFPTRAKAQAAIMAGRVRVDGHARPKAGLELRDDALITVAPDASPYVSRGGIKLAAAVERFEINPQHRTAMDLGSSTGGFSDCLLQRGAAKVYAVDVGTKQLDAKLRADPRVVVMENTHAKDLRPEWFDPLPDLLVADVSFISLTKVLVHALACLRQPAELVTLVKPQFELEPKKVPKGIVREEPHRKEAIDRVRAAAARLGLVERGLMESPITGSRGNVEYLMYWTF